ncbi:hypothetical protein POM88_017967 [Heracleum sosnowskyi]|uniref:Uncharacterized protein n=1 Tax=Heracleum sosnowskyi TaxID=360622 RepID=A0AAD8IRH5_9APIA|nr:hypothetical protein POM88_017967 [Heracleum sosnowskyi]
MTTRTRKTFRGRLNDYERDELLLQMMEHLTTLNSRLEDIEAKISSFNASKNPPVYHEVDGGTLGNKDAEGKETVTGETGLQGALNNKKEPRKEEGEARQQSIAFNWPNFINRSQYEPRDTTEPDFDGRFECNKFY